MANKNTKQSLAVYRKEQRKKGGFTPPVYKAKAQPFPKVNDYGKNKS